jgi:poly-gamma-glutamate synthesis protein (capsule biosynthesis protein)
MSGSKEVRILVAGDFMIQKPTSESDRDSVSALLAAADLRIGNMDTVLSWAGQSGDKFSSLRGSPYSIPEVKAMGFEVVTLANNHSMDYGPDGLMDMIQGFTNVGMTTVGAGANLSSARKASVFEFGPKKIAVFSFACTLPPGSAARENSPGIAPIRVHQAVRVDTSLAAEQPGSSLGIKTWVDEADLAATVSAIEEINNSVDHVIVVIHWGVPTLWRTPIDPQVQDYQYELGHALVDAGVDVIVGNHPHELHAVEYYKGVPIAFSLGNFWIDTIAERSWMARESIAVRLTFDSDALTDVELLPLMLTEQGIPEYDPSFGSVEILRNQSPGLRISQPSADGWHRVTQSLDGNR